MAINATSIANTPQAQDDSYAYAEDFFNTQQSVRLDVMSNDLGGKAKSLYSLDDGDNALKDLLARDPNLSTSWEQTADGNEIRINAGQIEFRLGSGFDVNSIPQGEVYTDSFVYAIQMGNGTLSYAKVSISITGQNDDATISGDSAGSVVEDASTLIASGQLTVHDADRGENVFKTIDAAALQGQYGSFAFDASTGAWSYTLDNGTNGQAGAVQSLAEGEEAWETLVVQSLDGTAQQEIKVKVTGRNDAATISGDLQAGLQEDGSTQSASGALSVHDIDHGENSFKAVDTADLQGRYGAFSFDASTGDWGYALDNGTNGQAGAVQSLGAGEEAWDTLVVQSLDGTAQQEIKVKVTGQNDAATFGGADGGSVTEDSLATVSGTLTVDDIDGEDEEGFQAANDLQGAYGKLSINAAGEWTYRLDNGNTEVDALNDGGTLEDAVTVLSLDGTEKVVTVTINGKSDAPPPPPVTSIQLPTQSPVPTTTTTQVDNNDRNTLNGGSTNDSLFGLGGNDNINGQQGDDILDGGTGDDDINGQQGNDYLYGGDGDDKLQGQPGNDAIYGGAGNDDISGGTGNDWLYGEAGADVFKYSNANEALDVVVNFESGIDKLHFSGAITGGGATYSLVQVDTDNSGTADSTLVRVDSNGAAAGGTVSDMVVLLGVTSVAATDIAWIA